MVSDPGGVHNRRGRRLEFFPRRRAWARLRGVDQVIEVRYAGTVVAKSAGIRDRDDAGLFLSVNEPMPVGTILTLTVDEAVKHGRVEQVVESTEAMQAGMRIRFVDGPVARPAPRTAAAPAVPAAPSPPKPAVAPASAAVPDAIAEVTEDESAAIEGAVASTGPIETGGGDPNQGQGGGGGRRRRRRR